MSRCSIPWQDHFVHICTNSGTLIFVKKCRFCFLLLEDACKKICFVQTKLMDISREKASFNIFWLLVQVMTLVPGLSHPLLCVASDARGWLSPATPDVPPTCHSCPPDVIPPPHAMRQTLQLFFATHFSLVLTCIFSFYLQQTEHRQMLLLTDIWIWIVSNHSKNRKWGLPIIFACTIRQTCREVVIKLQDVKLKKALPGILIAPEMTCLQRYV